MFEWNEKFSVNVVSIDVEHKKLIDIINKADSKSAIIL